MAQHYDLTSVGVNPADDRSRRMTVYFIAMTVRIACVASLFFVRGWWILLVGLAAVILPYFAVIFANERGTSTGTHPDQPTPVELTTGNPSTLGDEPSPNADAVVVVDALADRRATSGDHSQSDAGQEAQGEGTREDGNLEAGDLKDNTSQDDETTA